MICYSLNGQTSIHYGTPAQSVTQSSSQPGSIGVGGGCFRLPADIGLGQADTGARFVCLEASLQKAAFWILSTHGDSIPTTVAGFAPSFG